MSEELENIKRWLKSIEDEPLEQMADFFAARIGDYEEHMAHWAKLYEEMGKKVPEQSRTLLDIGCGTGLELDEIFRYHPEISVTAVDLSPEMLQVLKEKHPNKNLRLITADYFLEPFGTESYDVAVSFETLHHYTAEKKLQLFQKVYKCLKEGGCYLEVDYVADDDEWGQFLMEECARRRKKWNIPAEQYVHFDTPLTLEHECNLLREAGFTDIDVSWPLEGDGTPMILASKT
ncbi:MAG: class I SAM-dependent methyltransferase [Lachnospiraceae bacterium]|nr:class I SAM-dependent methyltransferase [Lachnospiraceae bacterium]